MSEHIILGGMLLADMAALVFIMLQVRASRREAQAAAERHQALFKASIDHLAALRGQR